VGVVMSWGKGDREVEGGEVWVVVVYWGLGVWGLVLVFRGICGDAIGDGGVVLVFRGMCGDADVNGGRGMGDGVSLGGGGMKFYDGLR